MATFPHTSVQPIVLQNRTEAFRTLLPLLREHDSFLVTSHARPDGDAVGSALGAMHLLESMGKQVTVAFADPIPRPFAALAGAERIVHEQPRLTGRWCWSAIRSNAPALRPLRARWW